MANQINNVEDMITGLCEAFQKAGTHTMSYAKIHARCNAADKVTKLVIADIMTKKQQLKVSDLTFMKYHPRRLKNMGNIITVQGEVINQKPLKAPAKKK